MGEPASLSTILPAEARPPTPPRESERRDLRSNFLGRIFSKESSSRRSSSSSHLTPPDSSLESPSNTSGSVRKKVGWAASADYSEPPVISFNGEGLSHSVQPLPPSAERKPTKSILKAYNASQEHDHSIGSSSTKLLPPHQHPNFATMLQSIVQQLAGHDRTSKIDAYLMLSSSLKASDNVPDIKALKSQMSLICDFISQDITSKVETGKPDSPLIVNALSLLAAFLQKGAIAENFPSEFQVNVVEYAIKAFADGLTSKEVVRHLIFLMAQQSFSVKVMSQDRVVRLIHALHTLENQVKGKSIVTGRLQVYRNLLRRSKPHMLANTEWMEDLFVDMRSSNKDIRNAAIVFGLESSYHLGTESGATRAMSELFKVNHSEGVCFAEFYAASLRTMVKKKDEGSAVPQIWSVIILFLRAKPQLYEKWTYMKLFLDVLSDSWNSSDPTIKSEANYAWNRFIFAVQLSENTTSGTRARLFQPLIMQIKQRKSQTARKSALNSIYHLLYYAFSPNSTAARLDMYWDEYVKPLMMEGLITDNVRGNSEVAKSDIDEACTILYCLFDTSRQRPWNENRVVGNTQQNTMSVKELPALDAKWLRNRVSKLVPVLSSILEKVYWDLVVDDSPVTKLWQTYLKTIALPAKMEVKVSNDTMNCIASLFGILHKIWTAGRLKILSLPQTKGPYGPNTTPAFLRCFEKIVLTAIDALGPLAFTEKLLSISQNTFIAVATPSQQPKRIRGEIKCPLNHLVLFLMTISPDLEYDQGFSSMVRRILLPFFEARKSSISKREFVKDLFNLLPLEPTEPSILIWQVLAEFASLATDLRDKKEAGKHSEEPLGASYRETIKILEAGHRYSPSNPLARWKLLFEALVTSSTLDAGDAGRAVAVIEPLANVLIPKDKNALGLSYLHMLLTKASYPKDRQALDIARKRMWGTAQSTQKLAAFDPYTSLYDYVQISLESAYESFSKQNTVIYADIIAGTSNLLGRCPKSLLLGALARTQNGIAHWISDPESHLTGGSGLSQAILTLWSTISNSISQVLQTQKHNKVLNDLETMICCGLESKHKMIVTSSVRSWNSTFGSCKEHLQYPDRVKAALARLHPIADILLPFFPDSLETEVSAGQAQRIEFAETQNDSTIYPGISSTDSFLQLHPPHAPDEYLSPASRRLRQTTPQVILSSLRSANSKKRSRESTPDTRGRALKKRDITPKARHDDSQVQFEAIQSSPIADRMDESQLLTEKQKDTRERQLANAAMFPDLRSSPRIREKAAKAETLEDPELPRHQSRSRSRSMHSPEAPRPTTPTYVPPSDDDQFVASSPTPTRSVRDAVEDLEPPSSPPESAIKKRPTLDELVVSSPESTPEVENDVTMLDDPVIGSNDAPGAGVEEKSLSHAAISKSDGEASAEPSLDPSAQINPFEYTVSLTSSIWESTGEMQRASSPIDGPSDQLRADASQHHPEDFDLPPENIQQLPDLARTTAANFSSVALAEAQVFHETNNSVPPGTPPRNRQLFPSGEKTPRTPAFVDAPTSPLLSDLNAMNEDVFEDAISSPQSHIEKGKENAASSPLSDIDETSLLRIVAEFDQGSGRITKQVTFIDQQEDEEGRVPASATPLTDTVSPVRKSASPEMPNIEQQDQGQNKESSKVSSLVQASSVPSLIPETPGLLVTSTHTPYYDDEGEEVDMWQTIVVDESGYGGRRVTVKRRAGRTPSKKRKLQEVANDSNGVSDSPVVGPEPEASTSTQKRSPTKRGSPAKKKRRGRPSKQASQLSLTSEANFENESSHDPSQAEPVPVASTEEHHDQDQDIFFVDIEALEDVSDKRIDDQFSSPIHQSMESASPEPAILDGQVLVVPETMDGVQPAGEDTEMSQDLENSGTSDIEVVEETRIDDSVVENPSRGSIEPERDPHEKIIYDIPAGIALSKQPASVDDQDRKEVNESVSPAAVEEHSGEEITGSELSSVVKDQNRQQSMQEQPGVAARMIESVKNRLRSVIGDLNLLGLGRRDTSELEDLFMDGKRALYQAESRGRGSADS